MAKITERFRNSERKGIEKHLVLSFAIILPEAS